MRDGDWSMKRDALRGEKIPWPAKKPLICGKRRMAFPGRPVKLQNAKLDGLGIPARRDSKRMRTPSIEVCDEQITRVFPVIANLHEPDGARHNSPSQSRGRILEAAAFNTVRFLFSVPLTSSGTASCGVDVRAAARIRRAKRRYREVYST